MTSATKTQTAAYEPSAWDLSELLPQASEAVIEGKLAELEGQVAAFETRRAQLNGQADGSAVLEAIQAYETILQGLYVLHGYGSLWFSADTQSPAALAFRNRMSQVLTAYQNRILFFELWWKGLDDETAAALLPSAAAYPDYHFYLESSRRFKPFTLSEPIEQVINTKDANGMEALLTIYSMITNRMEFTLEVEGETKTLTRAELTTYVYSPQPALREAAYRELFRVYAKDGNILAQIYVNRVRDWYSEQVELRRQSSPIAVRNLTNHIPDAAVETLLAVARRNAPVFQRYFTLKAGWLGLERLRRYDIYAPLAASDKTIPYGEAVQVVLETLQRFDPTIAAYAERVFTENHIDSEVRKGKRGGAFCATVLPELTPWVLMNYTGRTRDVATLAHELGHAIHSMMAADHSLLTQHSSLPLAETASVFAEILLTERLLAEERDPLVRRELLAAAVDDIYATVMRQAYFVVFEQEAHAAILENRGPEELDRLYLQLLQEQFGASLELGEEFRHEWISIPHIYSTPFYCYAYSFGQLLVLALYRRYQQEGEAFKPGYLRLLAYGGSASPTQILSEAGIDMCDPDFWQGGFDVISSFIAELEAIQL